MRVRGTTFILATATLLSLIGCNGGPNKTNIELIQNMMDQVSIKSQDWDPKRPGQMLMRMPPKNSIPRERAAYEYANDPAAGEAQKNPLSGDYSTDIMDLGRKNYQIYCSVCHGSMGAGDGPVAEKMPVKPRNLINSEAKAYSDGRIHFAIAAGRGVMGSYANQIPNERHRWAIVNYVRTLQR